MKESKNARKRRKRREQANQAAEDELAEITLEQQVLKEMSAKNAAANPGGPSGLVVESEHQEPLRPKTPPAPQPEPEPKPKPKAEPKAQPSGKKSKQPISLNIADMISALEVGDLKALTCHTWFAKWNAKNTS